MSFKIIEANESHISFIYDFIQKIALYEKLSHEVEITKEQLNLEIIDLEAKIKEFSVRLAIAKQSFKDIEEQARIKASEELEKEKFKRWKCPVCLMMKKETLNYMEQTRCSICNTNSRDSPKTEIVNIKGD